MTKLNTILVLAQHDSHGALTETAAQTISYVRDLTDNVVAVTLGQPDTDALAAYGVSRLYVGEVAGVGEGREASPSAWVEAALAVSREVSPDAIFLTSSYPGKETAAQLAVALDSGAVVDADGVSIQDDRLAVHKAVFSGTWATQGTVIRGIPVVALRPNSAEATRVESPTAPTVETISVTVPARDQRIRLVERTVREQSGVSLSEADVVVCGGRGVEGDFSGARELADLLGGAVGSTRVAADEGWIDRSTQIGQTGETISPKVYIGLGVSGAIHHTTGMQTADVIIAVCDDSEAPIFEMADFGVVGKVQDVLPQAIEALRASS